MPIKTLRVTNFKSFRDLELELGKFNVLIGANASGKSNFVHIFRFLRDIANHGLDDAISMQGGVEYLPCAQIGPHSNLSIEVTSRQGVGFLVPELDDNRSISRLLEARITEATYRFVLEFGTGEEGYRVAKDTVTLKCQFYPGPMLQGAELIEHSQDNHTMLGKGQLIASNIDRRIVWEVHQSPGTGTRQIAPVFMTAPTLPNGAQTLLESSGRSMPVSLDQFFGDISIFDFGPKLPKKAVLIAGKRELDEDGSNLAIALKHILEDKSKKKEFYNLMKSVLPFVDDLTVQKFADKSMLFTLREVFSNNRYFPASLMSDGTINVTALIVALYFEGSSVIAIEEPEKNVHPHLISKIVAMIREASERKQIIITTHSPEVVKYAKMDDILLVARDKEGFSSISRPAEKEGVKVFLRNHIGIDELYTQNLLGA